MVVDPISVRVVQGRLLIASSNKDDPVHIIRQTSSRELEVHLSNGATYVESFDVNDLNAVVLSLLGYRKEQLVIKLKVYNSETPNSLSKEQQNLTGKMIMDYLLEPVAFMPGSRFIACDINYEVKPSHYEVVAAINFWCRADKTKDIINAMSSDEYRSIVQNIIAHAVNFKLRGCILQHIFFTKQDA